MASTDGIGRGPRAHRLLEALAFDPRPAAPRQLAEDAGGVRVAEARVVELRQDFGLLEEPRAPRRRRVHVHPQRDPALEDGIGGEKQQALVGLGDEAFDVEQPAEALDVEREVVHVGAKLTGCGGAA